MQATTIYQPRSFKAIGIISFHRQTVPHIKPKKPWWSEFLDFFMRTKEIPELEIYHYELVLHVDNYKIGKGTVIQALNLVFTVVDWEYQRIQIKTIQPASKWLTYRDFVKTEYGIISTGFGEG